MNESQRSTETHLPVSISDNQGPATTTVGGVCSKGGLTPNATSYSNACEKKLSSESGRRQQLTHNYEFVGVMGNQQIALKNSNLSTCSNLESTKICEPCDVNGENRLATNVCRECEEFLCHDCSAYHSKQRITRNHTLCDVVNSPVRVESDQCNGYGDETDATKECDDCAVYMCESCISSHQSQKATKHHQMKAVSLHCSLCLEAGKQVSAFHFCQDCTKSRLFPEDVLINAIVINELGGPDGDDSKTQNIKTRTKDEEKQENENQKTDELRPGKPFATKILSDSLVLKWEVPKKLETDTSTYQLRYKERDNKHWTFYTEQPHTAHVVISGLMSKCTYIFQVRANGDNIEGPYSQESEEVTTKSSYASRLLPLTTKTKDGNPSIHKIKSTEDRAARDVHAKTRKLVLGKPTISNNKEKTILLVGETGSGKSTLLDAIINYITGVNWKDSFRFTLIDLESDEQDKNQTISQTEWITCYSVNPEEGSRINYTLRIIDTPGFGDTSGSARDRQTVDQLRKLFSSRGEKDVKDIDAVCFIVRASDARLTTGQKNIFTSMLSLFGKDIEDNICTLITFADGGKPPVLAAMQEANIPVKSWYLFNNLCLFANNGKEISRIAPMLWEMSSKSFKSFFDGLQNLSSNKSLQQTKQVSKETYV